MQLSPEKDLEKPCKAAVHGAPSRPRPHDFNPRATPCALFLGWTAQVHQGKVLLKAGLGPATSSGVRVRLGQKGASWEETLLRLQHNK